MYDRVINLSICKKLRFKMKNTDRNYALIFIFIFLDVYDVYFAKYYK